jgi:hypothetical protein
MSDQSLTPGVFVKGERRRQANTAAQAVALVADGYARAEDQETEAPSAVASDTAPVPVESTPTPAALFGSPNKSQEDE